MNYYNSNNNTSIEFNKHAQQARKHRLNRANSPASQKFSNSYNKSKAASNPVISGYFVKEKSYKEIVISRINAVLCGILGFLVLICLVSYYFVVVNESQLRKLSKETLALTYDNADMQNKLDNLQSFSNVDLQVTKHNTLQRAKQVIELSAADLPDVEFDKLKGYATNKYLGY